MNPYLSHWSLYKDRSEDRLKDDYKIPYNNRHPYNSRVTCKIKDKDLYDYNDKDLYDYNDNVAYIYGNYKDYYTKRNRARIGNFDSSWFHSKRVLDIGCNSGNITLDIARLFSPTSIVGVDIDPDLIKRAKYSKACLASLSSHSSGSPDYYPISCPLNLGTVASSHLSNVTFRLGDWVNEPLLETDFDVVLALSITKWIHLHGGDGGLKFFFKKCWKSLLPGGLLILEPQMSGYQKRAYTPKMKQTCAKIKLEPKDFANHLVSLGFLLEKTLHIETQQKGFERSIFIFRKPIKSAETCP